jgi:hypothetical protein
MRSSPETPPALKKSLLSFSWLTSFESYSNLLVILLYQSGQKLQMKFDFNITDCALPRPESCGMGDSRT